jgi:hypothetical protein
MRTCAAAIRASQETGDPWNTSGIIAADAMNLLEEAANELDLTDGPAEEPLGEPMPAIIPRQDPQPPRDDSPHYSGDAVWGGPHLPGVGVQPCPSCGTISARTVRRKGRALLLTCPDCEHQWEYGR